jgi:phosphoglycerate dehydrogenase-like enzyme
MSRVVVAVTFAFEPELLARIAAVDEQVELLDASAPLADAEVALVGAPPRQLPQVLREAVRSEGSRLRWVQSTWAGAGEQYAAAELSPDELERVVLTTSAGVYATPLAEFALFGLLAFAKDFPRLLRNQAGRRWDRFVMAELRDWTVLVLGVGGIGREIARLARAFGAYTIGVKRTPGEVPNLDEVHSPDRLRELLPRADALVVTLPITAATRRLIDGEALSLLPSHAVLVNVGRGAVVDEEALVDALRAGRLAGAALDVFAVEPLPTESSLWGLPNVLIAPHTAGQSVHDDERLVELFCDNLRRYLRGEPLRNRVDPEHYY